MPCIKHHPLTISTDGRMVCGRCGEIANVDEWPVGWSTDQEEYARASLAAYRCSRDSPDATFEVQFTPTTNDEIERERRERDDAFRRRGGKYLTNDAGVPEILRSLSDDELSRVVPPSQESIRRSLERGRKDRDAARRRLSKRRRPPYSTRYRSPPGESHD